MNELADPDGFTGPKAPGALRTIGEVALALGIRHHVLRYWEDQFPMLRPIKRGGGRRYYRPEDVALLRTIHRLVDGEGYTLRGARLAIEAGGKTDGDRSDGDKNRGDKNRGDKTNGGASVLSPGAFKPTVAATISSSTSDMLKQLRQVRDVLSEALAAS